MYQLPYEDKTDKFDSLYFPRICGYILKYMIFKSGQLETNSFNIAREQYQMFFQVLKTSHHSILCYITPREYTVKYCPVRKGTLLAEELYVTVYLLPCLNMDTVLAIR